MIFSAHSKQVEYVHAACDVVGFELNCDPYICEALVRSSRDELLKEGRDWEVQNGLLCWFRVGRSAG